MCITLTMFIPATSFEVGILCKNLTSVRLCSPLLTSAHLITLTHQFQGASQEFLIDIARLSHTCCFAPKEILAEPPLCTLDRGWIQCNLTSKLIVGCID